METGPEFREEHVLGGYKIVLRHIQPSDAPELRRELLALSPESRYRRFFGATSDLDDAALAYLTQVDGRDHVAIVATTESLDLKSERGVGVARFVRDAANSAVAEPAVTVVDDMQRIGIGATLTKVLARAARERGVERFRCDVLETNEVVVDALLDAGAVEVERGDGAVVLDVSLASVEVDSALSRSLSVVAQHVNAFLRRLLPPARNA